jgi:hypothetical protein
MMIIKPVVLYGCEISHIKMKPYVKGILDKGAEENIWIQGG